VKIDRKPNKTLLNKKLKRYGAFQQHELLICSVGNQENNMSTAHELYKLTPVSIVCPNSQERLHNQCKAVDVRSLL
jgi:hypothetical protein